MAVKVCLLLVSLVSLVIAQDLDAASTFGAFGCAGGCGGFGAGYGYGGYGGGFGSGFGGYGRGFGQGYLGGISYGRYPFRPGHNYNVNYQISHRDRLSQQTRFKTQNPGGFRYGVQQSHPFGGHSVIQHSQGITG